MEGPSRRRLFLTVSCNGCSLVAGEVSSDFCAAKTQKHTITSQADPKKDKAKDFDLGNAVVGAKSTLSSQMWRSHKELTKSLGTARTAQREFGESPSEFQAQHEQLQALLAKRIEMLELVLGSAQSELPTMKDVNADSPGFAAKAQAEHAALMMKVNAWAKESGTMPMSAQVFDTMGVCLGIMMSIVKLGTACQDGEQVYRKTDLDREVSALRIRFGHIATVVKRVKACVDKSKTALKQYHLQREKDAQVAEREAAKEAALMQRQAAAEKKKVDQAVAKAGVVASFFDMDYAKLGGKKIPVYSPEAFQVMKDDNKVDGSEPWCVKASTDMLRKLRDNPAVKKTLSTYESAFPGSAAATRGKRRTQTALDGAESERTEFLREFHMSERSTKDADASPDLTRLHVWGYGEEYQQKGTEALKENERGRNRHE